MDQNKSENPNEEDELIRRINRKTYGKRYEAMHEYLAGRGPAPSSRSRYMWPAIGIGLVACLAFILCFCSSFADWPGEVAPSPRSELAAYLADVEYPIDLQEFDVSRSADTDPALVEFNCATGYRYYQSAAYDRALPYLLATPPTDSRALQCQLYAADCLSRLQRYGEAIEAFATVKAAARRVDNADIQYLATYHQACAELWDERFAAGFATLRSIENWGSRRRQVARLLELSAPLNPDQKQ